ncbi:MAG: hypothetical protein FWB73_00035 [Treponema sp.]|nr:hypothetical protein [Treponema sp.]
MQNQTLATKADIALLIERIDSITSPVLENSPGNPTLAALSVRLINIEKICKASVGLGLEDIPIDAETVAVITGLALSTVKKYGAHRALPTIKIGKKLQYSLKGCIALVKAGSRKMWIDCTTEMSKNNRKKR